MPGPGCPRYFPLRQMRELDASGNFLAEVFAESRVHGRRSNKCEQTGRSQMELPPFPRASMHSLSKARSISMAPSNHHCPAEHESWVAPFRVIADFREAVDGWQFMDLPDPDQPGRSWTVPLEYRYLETADYTIDELSLFIVRRNATDFLAELRHWPESIAQQHAELRDLEASGAACLVVIEGDAELINQILGESDESGPVQPIDFGIPWLLADSQKKAELIVFEVMRRAWQRSIRQEPPVMD